MGVKCYKRVKYLYLRFLTSFFFLETIHALDMCTCIFTPIQQPLSPAVLQDVSPDDGAQVEITAGLSDFAGSFKANGQE